MKTTPIFALIFFVVPNCFGEKLTIRNNCGHSIYVKSERVNTGPFTLHRGASKTVTIDREKSARVWAHSGCNGQGQNCDSTEGYVSLAEMFWDKRGMTWYDVSHVDGYNLPIRMDPFNPGAGGNCRSAKCSMNVGQQCPHRNRVNGKNRRVVACKNLNRDVGTTEYSQTMKRICPGVYTWSKDDNDGMRACNPGNNGLRITFC